jgi:peptide/nickel transport system substrate-binding protein
MEARREAGLRQEPQVQAAARAGLAGGKVVKLDRVEWVWIPDPETQLNALISGEIDMLESVAYDHLPVLEKAKGVKVIANKTSNQYGFRMNWLQPPFNNVKVRQAVAYALSQDDFLQASVGDKRFYRPCKAMFTCDSPLASTAGMEGLIEGNVAKAKQLLAEAGYKGEVVAMPQPTDLGVIKQLAPVAKAQLEKAGFKVEVQPSDWQSMVARLNTNKGPVSEGGWSGFGTSWVQLDILDPVMTPWLVSTCEKARAGWPCDADMEKLRDAFIAASTPADKKAAAEAVQKHAMQIVTHVPLGEWFAVWAVRSNIEIAAVPPPITVFWGISKK